jgi:hypothetical protein
MEDTKLIKIDIGSGRAHFEDYITLDKDPSVKADYCVDIEGDFSIKKVNEIEFLFVDNHIGKVDEIRAHHILEHLKPENKVKVMALFHDLLKVGGILDIEVPLFPHPASVQDPTHISFWVKESFKYFIKGDPFGEAFAKRYSQYPVPLFEFVEEWYRGDEGNSWGYGIELRKV